MHASYCSLDYFADILKINVLYKVLKMDGGIEGEIVFLHLLSILSITLTIALKF